MVDQSHNKARGKNNINMLFDRAFVLLCVTLSGVAGFAPPQAHLSVSRVAACVPKVGVLYSEVEEATEASSTDEEVAAVPVESDAAFDTAIYVGNISFGELIDICDVLCCNCS